MKRWGNRHRVVASAALPWAGPQSFVDSQPPGRIPGQSGLLNGPGGPVFTPAGHQCRYSECSPKDRVRLLEAGMPPSIETRRKGPTANTRGHRFGTKNISGAPEDSEAPETSGGPSRTRTLDPLIKRPFSASFHPSHSSLRHITQCHISPRRVWRFPDSAHAPVAA
jgi:hypothetical protein